MTASPLTSSALRRTATHLAIAAAAVAAAMFTLAPPAAADEDGNGSGTTTEPSSNQPTSDPTPDDSPPAEQSDIDRIPTEQPTSDEPPALPPDDNSQPTGTDPTGPAETEPDPLEPMSTEGPTASTTTATDAETAGRQAALAAVEPDFGYTKFRVGVQIADGSYVPAGTTTLGSQITIVETGPNVPGGTLNTTCTTTAFLDPSNPTASYCQNLSAPGPFADFYLALLESIVTITQTSVNANLAIADGTKTVVPTCDDPFPFCLFNLGDVLLTDIGVRDRDDDDHDDDDDGDDRDEVSRSTRAATLPDTGGEDPRLLAYGVALLTGGGSLLALGRRRRAYAPRH